MKQCRLCFELTREEEEANQGRAGLMFPSLRASCDVVSVPFLLASPFSGKIVRKTIRVLCHRAWRCTSCGVTGKGSARNNGPCRSCGNTSSVRQLCTQILKLKDEEFVEHPRFKEKKMEVVDTERRHGKKVFICETSTEKQVEIDALLERQGCIKVKKKTISISLKVLGVRLRSARRDMAAEFSRFIVGARRLLDPRFEVCSNCVILRDARDNQILVAICPSPPPPSSSSSATAKQTRSRARGGSIPTPPSSPSLSGERIPGEDPEIILVVQGHSPETWRESVPELIELCDAIEPLCPICVQADMFNSLLEIPRVVGAVGTSTSHEIMMRCREHHDLALIDAERGVAVEGGLKRKKRWLPVYDAGDEQQGKTEGTSAAALPFLIQIVCHLNTSILPTISTEFFSLLSYHTGDLVEHN